MSEDMGEVWDRILASTRPPESTTPSAPPPTPTTCRLKLRAEPNPRHLPAVRREPAGIATNLRAAIRSLVRGESPWPLFVHGPAGLGKTCAALCLLDHADGATLFYTAAELCEHLAHAQQGRVVDDGGVVYPATFWSRLARYSLVVLDELACRDRVSDHHYECVKRLIDERHGRPLVVCSNLDLSRVERVYDDRVASRLAAGTVIGLKGKDRRVS